MNARTNPVAAVTKPWLTRRQRMAQTVVITGASAGVGRETARRFGERGAKVALIARGAEGLRHAADEVNEAGGTALTIEADVSDFPAVDDAAGRVEDELGPIDVWINNAFVTVFAPFSQIEPEEFRRVTDVTYHGYMHGTKAALDRMLPRNSGTIVQVGSALAYRGIPLQAAYCGAKHAIQGFTEALRSELQHDHSGVRITMVELPAVNTPQFTWALSRLDQHPQPMRPIYQPEVAANAIVYAASHPGRREYDVGIGSVATIVANKIAPGFLDRYLARTGYAAQQTDRLPNGHRSGNLWEPADYDDASDHGARGPFVEARSHSPQWWLSQRRALLACGAAAVALLVAGRSLKERSSTR